MFVVKLDELVEIEQADATIQNKTKFNFCSDSKTKSTQHNVPENLKFVCCQG